jgi:L-fuculose-phosphate aldolase
MSFEEFKYEVCIANRALFEVGLAAGPMASLGHISMRVPGNPDRFIVKGRGYEEDAIPLMKPEDMVVCDLEGRRVEARPGITQCYEVKIHSCIFRAYPEVQSVIHVHPRYAVTMSILGAKLRPACNEGSALVRTPPPMWMHNKLVQSDKEGSEVAALCKDSRVALLVGHGAVAHGRNMGEAFMNMFNLEEQARMNYNLYCAAGPDYPGIPANMLAEGNVPRSELDHFADEVPGPERPNGVFLYYTKLAAHKLETGQL